MVAFATDLRSLLPPLAGEAYARLREQIATNGLLVPVIVSSGPIRQGEIVDGYERALICAEVGTELRTEERAFASEVELLHYRLSVNVHRRMLSQAAAVDLGLRLEPLVRELAKLRRAQAAGRPRGEKALPVNRPEQSGETRAIVASYLPISAATFERGKKVIQEGSAELVADYRADKLSTSSALAKLKREQQRVDIARIAAEIDAHPSPLPDGRFNTIAVDPPWPQSGIPYPPMPVARIADLPIPALLTDDGCVFLWTTNHFLPDAFRLAARWQLDYRSTITWAKPAPGLGQPVRGQTEHFLFLSRGKPLLTPDNHSTLLEAPVREHSRKPDEFFSWVETLTHGSRLELFAREPRPGWHSWGAELDKFSNPTSR